MFLNSKIIFLLIIGNFLIIEADIQNMNRIFSSDPQSSSRRIIRQAPFDSDEDATGGASPDNGNFDGDGAKEEENSPDTMMIYDDDSPVTEESEGKEGKENIGARPSVAKRKIQSKATDQIGGRIDVICSRKAFSYVVNSEVFCEVEKADIVCLCYKQQG
uniref:Ground-like domain-containing protein n=1 Tax=Meloidogyne javanica TaxID=6303 RepID=A0A915MUU4_MELJA